jgi:CRISPR system Cascade subunit CasE
MYLSRLILNSRSREVRRDLGNLQHLHRTILSVFPQKTSESVGPRSEFGVLFRLEDDRYSGLYSLLVQSATEPNWATLPDRYLADAEDGRKNPACKSVAAVFKALENGMRLSFRIRANPTKKIDTRSGPGGERRNGRRVELRTEQQQIDWLRRKASVAGFQLGRLRLQPEGTNVRALGEGRLELLKVRPGGEGRARLTFASVLFEGELEITDATLFRQALAMGIGPGKAYGFGLLSLARL